MYAPRHDRNYGTRGASRGGYAQSRRRFRGQYFRTRSSPMQEENSSGPSSKESQQGPESQQQPQLAKNNHVNSQPMPQMDEIKDLCLRLTKELELVKSRVNDIANNLEQLSKKQQQPTVDVKLNNDTATGKKVLKKPRASDQNTANVPNNVHQNDKKKNPRRRSIFKDNRRKSFPELSDSEISELVQVLKRDFFSPDLDAVKRTIDSKGPIVAREFFSSILDHAMCDVTSPTKISEIATNLNHLIVGEQAGLEFQQGFYGALSSIAERENDIAIDAPRYMDTLGQILGECVVPMNTNRYRKLLKRFLGKSVSSYGEKSRTQFLASIMRGIARYKDDRFAKDVWDVAEFNWTNFMQQDNVEKFIESEDVKFTTQKFSPLPRKVKKTPEELEKFADDVTDLVEKHCTAQALEDMVRDMDLEADEMVDCLGTLLYAIVRGCLTTDSGDYKLDIEALSKYSGILKGKSQLLDGKKEILDKVVLRALSALTKLWHQYNCPQNLMSTILLSLNNQGVASKHALNTWLESDDLKNIPGIGAARLSCKRCIQDLDRAA